MTEEGELLAEIRGAVFSKLVLDVVCVRLAPDPRAGKLKSAAILKNSIESSGAGYGESIFVVQSHPVRNAG